MNYVGVKFATGSSYYGSTYTYKNKVRGVKVGDLVVVKVRERFKVVKVYSVEKAHNTRATKYIVDKINTKNWPEQQIADKKSEIKEAQDVLLNTYEHTKGTLIHSLHRELEKLEG